ncbi:hypothetical protein ADK93_33105 [Streptomyces sp. XY58]|nr:hypothetical protein ADK93_33105 [Streptomyces sp. XY58]KOV10273.1 hypothetical protein ADK89_06185 [Streptomyces sp. XY37]KOV40613.1 hypothetical protein ADK99_34480 [Streptomyces sp. MMG1064]
MDAAPGGMDAHPAPLTAGAATSRAVREALGDWRRDALLLCLLPVFCWPAVVAAVLTRPVMLVVLLGPVVLGVRELCAVRRVRRVVRDPAVRWVPYEAEVVRVRWRPPVLVLGDDLGEGRRRVLTLGVLGRRVLPPRPWPRREPAPSVRAVRLAGDPPRGGVLWVPDARRLGLARPVRPARASRATRPARPARPGPSVRRRRAGGAG